MSLLVYVAASRVESEAITDQLSRLLRDDERESEPVMTRVTNRNEFSPNQLRPDKLAVECLKRRIRGKWTRRDSVTPFQRIRLMPVPSGGSIIV